MLLQRTLSKSDFQLARSCALKLHWRENGLPDNRAFNPYLQLLADGGYMVEALARAMYAGGTMLESSGNATADAARTLELLREDNITLYQATFLAGRRLVRTDIIEKRGNIVRLIEVKAKSFDGAEHASSLQSGGAGVFRSKVKGNAILSPWIPKFEDLTYQVLVIERALPGVTVQPFLLLVDKSKRSALDNLPSLFALVRHEHADGSTRLLSADFLGSDDELQKLDLLTEVDASAEVASLRETVDTAATLFETQLDAPFATLTPPLGPHCGDCEFRTEPIAESGFAQCWGTLAAVAPHALGLFRVSSVSDTDGTSIVTALAREGKASLFDIPEARLSKKDGSVGPVAERQLRQLRHSRAGTTWVSATLRDKLQGLTYPMHFIDFEVSRLALPYHAKMRPYGQVAFQWSCHTVDALGATPRHTEWLNIEHAWPNMAFWQSLRAVIGDSDCVLTWSPYEQGRMNELKTEHEHFMDRDATLIEWVDGLKGRIFDLHNCAVNDFYHPGMGGRTSVKVVLDALWKSDDAMRDQYATWTDASVSVSSLVDPYHALPALEIAGVVQDVREGTGAMRAYEAMMYGVEKTDVEAKAKWRSLLLQYCKLDTLSMVLIFEHWRRTYTQRYPEE